METETIVNKNIKVFFIDGFEYQKPSSSCRTSACKALLNEINNAQKSIHFAIYGIENQPEIFNALLAAKKRGVVVKGVTDMTQDNTNIYADTKSFISQIQTVKTDYSIADENAKDFKEKFAITSAIMHNKFFVFEYLFNSFFLVVFRSNYRINIIRFGRRWIYK